MKIAFLGNCQLANVGSLFVRMAQQKIINAEILWTKPVFELTDTDYLPLFHALDRADAIYVQYHDTYHGMYATNHLAKYFKFKIVPTLESFVSTPQMGYWSDRKPILYYLDFIDFRILEMYLQQIEAGRAAQIYQEVKINDGVVRALIDKTAYKYEDRFDREQICFQYAPFYREMMQKDIESYFTMNHPSNRHLEWLTNKILADVGSQRKLVLDKKVPELLGQFVPPSFRNDSRRGQYVIKAIHMDLGTAIKMYYAYFDTIDANYLESELHRSVYHTICSGEPQNDLDVTLQNFAAATPERQPQPVCA